MAEIKVLPQEVADKIAAGEVVERPAAAVKELAENAIDAGATRIRVEIKNGGIGYICIEDNGKGIPSEELEAAFVRHATSKLRKIEDLFEIGTMGFRGEALASICAVAEIRVISRTRDSAEGVTMTVKHGVTSEKSAVACNVGTTMIVEGLFANVPARMKFLKKDSTEAGYVTDIMLRLALANPDIAFEYICDGSTVFSTSGDGQLKNTILNVYGLDHAKAVLEVDYAEHGVHVFGMVGKAELARGNRTRQTLLVNGRYVKNHIVSKVVEEAYRNVLMTGKFPFFVLNIELSPQLMDVNVHPAKTEIKFANEKELYNIVNCAVKNALYASAAEEKHGTATAAALQYAVKHGEAGVSRPDTRLIREFMENTVKQAEKSEKTFLFNEPMPRGEAYWDKGSDAERLGGGGLLKNAPPTENEEASEHLKAFARTDDLPDNGGRATLFDALGDGKSVQDEPVKVVGQVFDTYLVAWKGDKMFFIDQHAAHERKRFEMLKKDYTEKKPSGQILLSPIVLDVDAVELQAVRDNIEMLKAMGFEMEEFGRSSVIIRETPLIGDETEIKALAHEVISVLEDGRPMGVLSFEERILDTVSCKYAIKANKRLSALEAEALARDVEELESLGITTCPHGRPIKITFTKRELEKLFKRIV